MELKEISKIVFSGLDRAAENKINLLQNSFSQLLAILGKESPEQATIFGALNKEFTNKLEQVGEVNRNIGKYFTGNGPVAKRLKEHLGIAKALQRPVHFPTNVPLGILTVVSPISDLEDQIKRFNYNPIIEADHVQKLTEVTRTLRAKITAEFYETPYPPFPEGVILNLDDTQSGIYGDGADPANLQIVLRGFCEGMDGLEVLYISWPDAVSSLWFYHPFELQWVKSSLQETFPGAAEALVKQLESVMEQASPIVRDFVFEEEVTRLEKQAHAIFDTEDVLPKQVFSYPDGLYSSPIPARAPLGHYERTAEASEIMVKVDKTNIIFRNTRGKYPQRNWNLCRMITNDVFSKVDLKDLHRTEQLTLIQRTGLVLANITEVINSNKG